MTPPVPAEAGWQMVPGSEQVTLAECPVGLFIDSSGGLCLKTEYGNNEGRIDAYIVESGEFFWGSSPQSIANQRRQMVTPVALAAAPAPSPPPSADHAGLVERFIARAAELSDGGKYRWWADLSTALQQSAERIAGLERDINRYAWERDKAREERDAAERRAEAFWKPQLASRDAEIERLTRESSDWSNGDLNGVKLHLDAAATRADAAEAKLKVREAELAIANAAVDAFSEICDELGCARDSETGLHAVADLKAKLKVAVEALRAIASVGKTDA